jgi:plasmid replication initiation protein
MKALDKQTPQYVSMANELIKAAHNLTLMEKRVLMLAISKIDSKAKSYVNSLVRLTINEFVAEFGIDKDSAYRDIKNAVKGVRRRYARFFSVDTDGKPIEHDIDWTTRANYKDSEGWLEISINGDLNPYLYELKNHFTSYKLSRASALRSMYSWRLFELLMQFKSTGLLNIGINEFNKTLEVADSYTTDFSMLRARVIEPAVKEIREKDGLAVNWEAVKAGRKVKALKFTFKSEKPEAQPKPSTYRPIPPDTELETIDKPMTKVEARQLEASVMATVHPMLKPVAKITKEQAEQEFSALSKLASDIGSTVEKLSSVQQKEAFKEYGFLK